MFQDKSNNDNGFEHNNNDQKREAFRVTSTKWHSVRVM